MVMLHQIIDRDINKNRHSISGDNITMNMIYHSVSVI